MVMFVGMGKKFWGFAGIFFLQITKSQAKTVSDLSKTHYWQNICSETNYCFHVK